MANNAKNEELLAQLMLELEHLKKPKSDSIMQVLLAQLTKPKTISILRDAKGRAISLTQE